MPLTSEEYKKKAEAEYDPAYNQKITLLNNALNQGVDTLNSQKGGINEQYDTQVTGQNRNNNITKNNYSDLQTDRGLGRSTVATTGLSSLDDKNTRLIGEINKARGRDLGNIDTQITTLKNNTTNTIAQMGADRENSLSALIRQFQQEDIAKEERDRAFKLQQDQFEFQKQQAAIANARGGSSGSGGSKTSAAAKAAAQYSNTPYKNDYQQSIYEFAQDDSKYSWQDRAKKLYAASNDGSLDESDRAFAEQMANAIQSRNTASPKKSRALEGY